MTTYSEQKTATCETCGQEFTFGYRSEFGNWKPKLCYQCKNKAAIASGAPPIFKAKTARTKKSSAKTFHGESVSTGIFTDGGSRGNPGRGGWGYVYVVNNEIVKEGWGGEDYTTNNRMELTAIIEALKAVGNVDTTLYTDSNLSVQTYNEWMEGWADRGWRKKTGEIANLDLVQELYELKEKCPLVSVEWVKGHAGHRWNEYVDELTQKY